MERVGVEGEPAPAPFARARLDNGARVLVRENRAMPLVAVDCWLSVGTLGEPAGIVGVSHFLEHMFFKGTERFPTGEMDRIVKGLGGYNNAATSMEYTHYYIVAPSEHFETVLELLADHLERPALPADELVRERQVVKEEIRRKEDAPRGRLYTRLSRAAFGDTPYAREVLGTPDSLDRIDRDAMRDYWRDGYVGERLVVAIAGDVDPAAAADAVAGRLGGLREGDPPPPPPDPPEVEPAEVEEGMHVGQGYLGWAFPAPGRDNLASSCALEMGAAILGDGPTSRLHRRLVDERRLVPSVSAWTFSLSRIGLLGIYAVCPPDRRSEVEMEIAAVLDEVDADGVAGDEMERARATLKADFAYDNETNAALAGTLGEFEALHGDGGRFREVLRTIDSLDAGAVSDALSGRVEPERAVRAWVGPE
ncbi:MAG: pitrilysin family protein [Gemmatimonadota bacterium]|nr:pitrilysin family protein [Gemmatimonadota bacterium]